MTAAQRREQLLDVTKQLVGEQGFHAVSIEAVARRAGITRPIVYGHFHDLSGLLDAMLERETMRALGQLAAVLPEPGADRRQALLGAFAGYIGVVRADPVTWRLVLMPPEGAPQSLRDKIQFGRDAIVAALAHTLPEGESPDPALTARLLSAVSDEAARLLLTDPETYTVERLMRHAEWLLGRLVA
jgi:AcrR family transcriptional regulator